MDGEGRGWWAGGGREMTIDPAMLLVGGVCSQNLKNPLSSLANLQNVGRFFVRTKTVGTRYRVLPPSAGITIR